MSSSSSAALPATSAVAASVVTPRLAASEVAAVAGRSPPLPLAASAPPPAASLLPNSVLVAAKDIVAGTIGGMTTVVVGHPLDTVKVRLQTSVGYTSTLDCMARTWRGEGLRGFYKGVQSPLAGEAFFNAVQFLAYGQSKALLAAGDPAGALTVADYFVAGGLTGAASCIVECPVDLLKSQLQTAIHRPSPPFVTFSGAVRYIVARRGAAGLYQGLVPTFARTIPSTAAYFGCYEWTKIALTPDGHDTADASNATILLAGGVGGFMYWLSTYPFDSVKSAMQSDAVEPAERRYASTADCCRQLWAEGGWRRFYRGLAPCLLRSFPANAACFLAYERAKQFLG